MSDKLEISGQAGVVGDNAEVHGNKINQVVNAENSRVKKQIQGTGNTTVDGGIRAKTVIFGDKHAAPVPPSLTLHQLPPPPQDFIGRKKEMAELLKAIEKKGVTISGLQGLGGVGKTALALKLAESLKSQYPDAQFYLDLKGTSKQPSSAAEAMAHVIRSYHSEAILPEDEGRLQSFYYSLLNGKKILLLMDNAKGREQIEPLLPPPGCILLVTSRNRFTVKGRLFAKDLNALNPKDARQLLLRIAPRISNCAEKIAKLCGYLPLTLELAASAFHKLVMLKPEEFVERLSNATEQLELVEASLSLSYDLLTEELQKLWRMLAIFPNTFDTAAAAALWELDDKKTQNQLAELISYSLIEWNNTIRRYRLHDLLKLLAHNRLPEEERYAAGKRHAIRYWEVLGQAGDLYSDGGDKVIQGLSLFDLERENIDSGQDWAAVNMDIEEEVTHLTMKYYDAAYYLLSLRLHPREKIRWLEISLKAARKLGNKTFQSSSISNLGAVYADLGKTHKAIEYHEQALLIDRKIGDRRGEGYVLCNLGIAYRDLGEPRKAVKFHKQALLIDREVGDRRNESADLGNLGRAYVALGEPRKAIKFFEQRIVIAHEIGDRRGEGAALGNLGIAYATLGEARKAIGFYEKHLAIARAIGDRRGEGNTLWNSALAYDELGDRSLAISLAERALAIFEQIEAPAALRVRSTLDKWKAEETQ